VQSREARKADSDMDSEEYRHWFLKWETALFKYRYAQEEDKKGFIAKENINYAQVHTEKIRDMQRSLIFHGSELDNDTNFDKIIFFKVCGRTHCRIYECTCDSRLYN